MSYTKKTWSTGDTITADALNNLESGASANASAIAEIEKELPSYVGADVPRKAAATITPGTANQTIAANQYLTGAQTIKGDSNLVAANIKKGASIFGVTGTLEAGSTGTDTSDATATAGDILNGKTAYVKGEKVTGTITIKGAQIYTPRATDQTILAGYYLKGNQTIEGDANLIAGNIKKGVSIFGVAGELANSGGAVSKSGTVTGNGGEQTIDTGLSNIIAFLITSSSVPNATGLYFLVYMHDNLRAAGVNKGQYYNNYSVTQDSSTASISGGRVTLKSSNGYYKPINNAPYKWYAVGEA